MQATTYLQRIITQLLLIALLLQSCNNWNITEEAAFKKEQEEKEKQLNETIKAMAPNGEAIVKALANKKNEFNPDGSTFTDVDMLVLVEHPRFQQLTRIDLSCRQLSLATLKILADHLQSLTNLQDLSLCSNKLGDIGMQTLVPGLQGLTSLQSIYLWANQIGDAGTKALAAGIKGLTNLQMLQLSNNQIGNEGAIALAASLQGFKSLQYLYLPNNQIGDAGTVELAKSIKGLTALQYLCLQENQIGDAGATELSKGVEGLTNLVCFNLYNNQITDKGAREFGYHPPVAKYLSFTLAGSNDNISAATKEWLKKQCPNVYW